MTATIAEYDELTATWRELILTRRELAGIQPHRQEHDHGQRRQPDTDDPPLFARTVGLVIGSAIGGA